MNLKNIKQKLTEDRGVSPVIGVILMVAITVILAAIIGTFVLGLGKNVQTNASAGVTEAGNSDTVTLNSLGPSTDGIKCSGVSNLFDGTNTDKYTEQVGTELTCPSGTDSVVAYSKDGDASNASVHSFDN
ncbi:type IV pilin [Halorussus halophilus]|uniref:type IV pilin n=1 Tax=Halorussus halophilus TaxID=2650975 RepID=UPI00130199C5|nr:type IV pilin N-terminal domain-containing protein [Halorussus halophilus]